MPAQRLEDRGKLDAEQEREGASGKATTSSLEKQSIFTKHLEKSYILSGNYRTISRVHQRCVQVRLVAWTVSKYQSKYESCFKENDPIDRQKEGSAKLAWITTTGRQNWDEKLNFKHNSPIQTSRKRLEDRIIIRIMIGPDHRTKGQELTQIITQHQSKESRNPYPRIPRSIESRSERKGSSFRVGRERRDDRQVNKRANREFRAPETGESYQESGQRLARHGTALPAQ